MTRDTRQPEPTDRAGTPARSVARVGGVVLLARSASKGRERFGPRWRVGLTVLALFATGCRQLGNLTGKQDKPDLLEAELRTRERELQEARAEIAHLRQLADLHPGVPGYCPPGGVPPSIPHGGKPPAGGIPLRDVLLGNGTGGLDEDGRPGDEGLMVALVPKDDDGTAVKVPGTVQIAAFEISREGLKTPIGRWRITPEQLKKTWKSSLLSSGYFIPLQWDKPPGTDRVRVSVRFETTDGKPFEADKDFPVKPLPGVTPRTGGMGEELPPPGVLIGPGSALPGPTPGPTAPVGPVIPPGTEILPPPAYPTSSGPAAILKPFELK
jgi:hypothetical protein